MAENFNLIFGQNASQSYAWSDSDYQNGWQTVGDTPPTAQQFDALQRRADLKAQELNNALTPLVNKSEADGRQASTAYTAGKFVTVDGLPNGWLLECVVGGTSGASAISIPATLVDGTTIVDGDVTWKLRKIATEGGLGYRQPSTTYAAGAIAYHASLPTGYYLECTTAGTTGSGALSIGGGTVDSTISDGTVTWTVRRYALDFPRYGAFNKAETFTTSGSFVAPVTGTYRITLQGGGGGGGGAGSVSSVMYGGSGGSQGGHGVFYEQLTAGTSYAFTIGAGGNGGTAGNNGAAGGNSAITINSTTYTANGGRGGNGPAYYGASERGGEFKIGDTVISYASAGGPGRATTGNMATLGGTGGGIGGAASDAVGINGYFGGGGSGGGVLSGVSQNGGAGGDGYITFEYCAQS